MWQVPTPLHFLPKWLWPESKEMVSWWGGSCGLRGVNNWCGNRLIFLQIWLMEM